MKNEKGCSRYFPRSSPSSTSSSLVALAATPCRRLPVNDGEGCRDDGREGKSVPLQEANVPRKGDRRMFFSAAAASALTLLGTSGGAAANAFDKIYPVELAAPSDEEVVDERRKRIQRVLDYEEYRREKQPLSSSSSVSGKALGTFVWASALWFLTGSRSNPLVTPLANVVYDEEKEGWLKDRNEGLFSDLPLPLYALLAVAFLGVGFGLDAISTILADYDHGVSLQLAGVSLISGGALEIGRLASGEKGQTREESNRDTQLETEFREFAENRLKFGGNCHRSEVVSAFRRYYAKYRQADHPEYGLSDIEIERLLRNWSSTLGRRVEMSSAGFYSGLQINSDADAFKTVVR